MNLDGTKIKARLQTILKWFFIIYIIPTSVFGAYVSFNKFYVYNIHDSVSVKFNNGFIFASTDKRRGNYNAIFYPNGEIAIGTNVASLEESGDFVYGFRREWLFKKNNAVKMFYFICNINEDCSNTQNYKKLEFQKLLKERGISPYKYSYWNALKKLQVKEWILINIFFKDKLVLERP